LPNIGLNTFLLPKTPKNVFMSSYGLISIYIRGQLEYATEVIKANETLKTKIQKKLYD